MAAVIVREFRRAAVAVVLAGVAAQTGCDAATEPIQPPPGDTVAPVPEFTIRYITRLPAMEWVRESDDPTREGWPEPGQDVTWRAHVLSRAVDTMAVEYRWSLDGSTVLEGTLVLPPDEPVITDYTWPWTFERHQLRFELDPGDAIAERSEDNNAVELATDALSIGLYVERRFYDFYRTRLDEVTASWNSFEDWAHGHIRMANRMFERAVFEETPDGVLDRWRIDRITVVPDGSLTRGARNREDRTVDMIWGFRASEVDHLWKPETGYSPVFGFRGAFLHELGHARSLLDVYLWNLYDGLWSTRIAIMEDDEPVLGTPLFPGEGQVIANGTDTAFTAYRTPEQGLMNDEYHHLDRYSAIVLNRMAGERPRLGNHNFPDNGGESILDLPAENRLVLTDSSGAPLAGARVEVYQATWEGAIVDHFDDTPDMTLEADADGSVLLGSNPFGTYPLTYASWRAGLTRWHVILRVERDGRVGYTVLESRLFNLQYWRGNTDLGHYTLAVRLVDPA